MVVAGLLSDAIPPAGAHGPCECLSRYAGRAGQQVTVRSVSIRAVFNPTKAQLPYGPPKLWSEHRKGVPSLKLYRSRKPRVQRFTVPRVPAGKYLILINDGSEGGAHYTWGDFAVRSGRAASARPAPEQPPAKSRFPIVPVLALLVILLAASLKLRR